jgi:hypothetical protein
MLSPLRNRFGIPGVISVIALVFAMIGGAYAASSDNGGKATSSAKAKKGPRGPKGPKGDTGPAGAQGPAGPAGAKGDTGANGNNGTAGTSAEATSFAGSNGTCTEGGIEVKSAQPAVLVCNGKKGNNGTAGTSAEAISFAGNEHGCEVGGIEVKSSKPAVFVCNGKNGSPWVVGTAPDKAILKGTWAIPYYDAAAAGERVPAAISTGVPIPAGGAFYFAFARGVAYASAEEEGFAELLCPGGAQEPTVNTAYADAELGGAGVICIYALTATNLTSPGLEANDAESWGPLLSGGGAVANFKSSAAGVAKGSGSWAIYTK